MAENDFGGKFSIQTVNEDFKAAMTDSIGKFEKVTSAYALSYHDGSKKGVRIEAPELGLGFIDNTNAEYGRGPVGTLFYHKLSDLAGTAYYNVIYSNKTVKTPNCVIIQLYKTRGGTLFAQFVGLRNWDNATSTLTEDAQGTWGDLGLVTSFSRIDKNSGAKTVTIKADPIRKTVKFDIPPNIDISSGVHVAGQLLTTDLGLITKDTKSFVSWDRGRVVFYPEDGKTSKAVAVFFPVETADSTALSGVEEFTSGVAIATWADA